MDASHKIRGCYCVALWFAVLAYALVFSAITLNRYDRLVTGIFDLGIFDQSVWLVSRRQSPFLTTRGLYPFQDHFTPILYLLAPLYWIWPTPKLLLVLQSAALALGAVPVYNIAVKRLQSEALGLLFAVSYLLFPCIGWMNVFDFHPEVLAVPILLLACWYMESGCPRRFLASLVIALLCKETMGLTVALLGFYAWPFMGRRVMGITLAMGISSLILSMETLRYCNNGQPSAYVTLYSTYGHTMGEIAGNLLSHPDTLLECICVAENTQYLYDLLMPVGFLALAAPELLLLAAPVLLSNVLSNRSSMHTIYFQYNAQVVPFVIVAAIVGFHCLERLIHARFPKFAVWTRGALCALLMGGMAFGIAHGPLSHPAEFTLAGGVEPRQIPVIQQALAMIPPGASVSAQTAIAAHLAHRTRIFMFPNPFQPTCWGNTEQALRQQVGEDFAPLSQYLFRRSAATADVQYVILGPAGSSHFPLSEADYGCLVRLIMADPHYGVVWSKGGLIVLKRGASHN